MGTKVQALLLLANRVFPQKPINCLILFIAAFCARCPQYFPSLDFVCLQCPNGHALFNWQSVPATATEQLASKLLGCHAPSQMGLPFCGMPLWRALLFLSDHHFTSPVVDYSWCTAALPQEQAGCYRYSSDSLRSSSHMRACRSQAESLVHPALAARRNAACSLRLMRDTCHSFRNENLTCLYFPSSFSRKCRPRAQPPAANTVWRGCAQAVACSHAACASHACEGATAGNKSSARPGPHTNGWGAKERPGFVSVAKKGRAGVTAQRASALTCRQARGRCKRRPL